MPSDTRSSAIGWLRPATCPDLSGGWQLPENDLPPLPGDRGRGSGKAWFSIMPPEGWEPSGSEDGSICGNAGVKACGGSATIRALTRRTCVTMNTARTHPHQEKGTRQAPVGQSTHHRQWVAKRVIPYIQITSRFHLYEFDAVLAALKKNYQVEARPERWTFAASCSNNSPKQ